MDLKEEITQRINQVSNHTISTDDAIEDIWEKITEYTQALQLRQCAVSGCKTVRHCRECDKEVSCDKDFCSQKCKNAYYR